MSLMTAMYALASHPSLTPVLASVDDDDDGIGAGGAILIAVIVIALVALVIAALVSIARSPRLSGGGKLLWVVLVLVFPFLGSIAWFAFGRRMDLQRA